MGSLHGVMVKYAAKANQILDLILPVITNLPLIPPKAKKLLVELEEWTQKIIDNQTTTAKTITDVTSGLKSGDVSKLKSHSGELKAVSKNISAILSKTK